MRRMSTCLLLGAVVAVTGCSEERQDPVSPGGTVADLAISAAKGGQSATTGLDEDSRALHEVMVRLNHRLAAADRPFRVHAAEWIAGPGAERQGQIVFFDDRGDKRLADDWVPEDPRRGGRTNITYLVDLSDGATTSGLTATQTEGAIDAAMATWRDETSCSALDIEKVADPGIDPDVVDGLFGFGDVGTAGLADIVHAGWVPAGVLGPSTLGVTFTFVWIDGGGDPTDIDGNGKDDVAFREIYYNDLWLWGIDAPTPAVDVESVALHETGHGLSQAHFGKLFGTFANGKLHFAPFALMNAGYTQLVQELQGTDLAGHCAVWGGWPND